MSNRAKEIEWEGPFESGSLNQHKYCIANIGLIKPIVIESISENSFYSNTPWGFVSGNTFDAVKKIIQSHFETFISNSLDEPDLEAEMQKAGMFSMDDMLSGKHETKYSTHAGVSDIESFSEWLKKKREQYLKTRIKQEFKKNDELYDFVLGKNAAYDEIYLNFRKAMKNEL